MILPCQAILLTCLQVNHQDDNESDNEHTSPRTARSHQSTPSSPPPSFRSGASSPTFRRLLSRDDPLHNEADQTLADTFDDGEGSDDEDGSDDRQKLMRGDSDAAARDVEQQSGHNNSTTTINTTQRTPLPRRVTELPAFAPTTLSRHQPRSNNDGVFANLAAKPERGEPTGDEKPPVRILNILHYIPSRSPTKLTIFSTHRPTKPPPPTPPLHTGKQPLPFRAPASRAPTKSTSTVYLSVPSSPLPGTP